MPMAMKKVEAGRRLQKSFVRECHKLQGTWWTFLVEREDKWARGGVCRDECWVHAMKAVPIKPETKQAVLKQRRLRRQKLKALEAEIAERELGELPVGCGTGIPILDWVGSHMDRDPVRPAPAAFLAYLKYCRKNPDRFFQLYTKLLRARSKPSPPSRRPAGYRP